MGEYYTNGITVYDMDKCCAALKQRDADQISRIKYLEKENKKLKDEAYKDSELQRMKAELAEARNDLRRGFGISESEQKAIKEWKKKHETEAHGIVTDDQRMKLHGCIGGNYSYIFIPTSIGIVGEIQCSCGEKFTFCELM